MRDAQRIAAGKRWIGEAFERLRGAYRRTVLIVAWDWQEEDPESRIRMTERDVHALRADEFIPIMVYWASHERRHHRWPVSGSPMCRRALRSFWI